jgi:nucleoside-diphosphate kinase
MSKSKFERTLVIIKPDALQRDIVGEIIHRFERKGLYIVGMKMMHLDEEIVAKHYSKYADKDFFAELSEYMRSFPVVAIVLEGLGAIGSVRKIVGTRIGHEAEAGSIRGDFAMSGHKNIIHASDTPENSKIEIENFFKSNEIFDYAKVIESEIYGPDDLA